MPPLHSEPSGSAPRQKPISLLERSKLPPPPYRPSYDEVDRRLTARRLGQFSDADARNAAPMQKTFQVDDETRLQNERLARRVAESGAIAGLLPILESALSQDPETAPAQIGHLLQEVRLHAPEKADALERQLPQREERSTTAETKAIRSRAELIPPDGPKRDPLNEAIQGFIDFSKTEGLYDYLPANARETLNFALDLATILPGPSKAFVVAEFATMIAPAIEHVLKGDYGTAAETATDAIIYLPFAILAGRKGGKLAVKSSRHFRGSDLPSPAPLVAGAAITQLADEDFSERLSSGPAPYDVAENPPSSSPPPQNQLPPEDRKPYREEFVPPDLEDLLTQIPPTPGFTLADKDDIVEIFPDQRDEIPPILVVENRKGSQELQENHKDFADFAVERAKDDPEVGPIVLIGGGPNLPEAHFGNRDRRRAGLDSRRGGSYLDLTFMNMNTGRKLHTNSVSTLKDGVTADSREKANAIRGLQNIKWSHLMAAFPKARVNEKYDSEALYQALRPFFIELNKPWVEPTNSKPSRNSEEVGWIKIPPIKLK